MSPSATSTELLNPSRNGDPTTPPVPVPDHSYCEEIFPNIQPKVREDNPWGIFLSDSSLHNQRTAWSMSRSAPTHPAPCRSRCAQLAALSTEDGHCSPGWSVPAQTLHSHCKSSSPEQCDGKETPPGAHLLLLWVVERGSGVQHGFLGVVEELRDVLEVLGRALGSQRKRQPR